jgi:hypothetical protein
LAFKQGSDEMLRKLFFGVNEEGSAGANRQRLRLNTLVIFDLADIHRHRHDFGVIALHQPSDGDRGVQTTRIGEGYFHARRPSWVADFCFGG